MTTTWTPYATTATQFFEQHAPSLLAVPGVSGVGGGLVEFQIEGSGTWTIDFARQRVTRGEGNSPVQAIVKAHERDFMAMLEGRMTPADGFLTQRLHVSGEMATIGRLMAAVTPTVRA